MALYQTIPSQQIIIISLEHSTVSDITFTTDNYIISLEYGTVSDNTFTTDNYYLPWA